MKTNSRVKAYSAYHEIPKAYSMNPMAFGKLRVSAAEKAYDGSLTTETVKPPYNFLNHFYGLN